MIVEVVFWQKTGFHEQLLNKKNLGKNRAQSYFSRRDPSKHMHVDFKMPRSKSDHNSRSPKVVLRRCVSASQSVSIDASGEKNTLVPSHCFISFLQMLGAKKKRI